jgi:protein SCO1
VEEPAEPRFDVARVLVWAVAVAVVATAVGAAWLLPRREKGPGAAVPLPPAAADEERDPPPSPPPTTGLFPAPIGRWFDVPAVERSGRALGTAELVGRYLVVDFVFARCGGTCPRLQAAMQQLQDAAARDADVRLVSLTVDPERDDPAVLRTWAERLGADPERWLFLRIEDEPLRRLMREALKVPTADELIAHSNYFMLVDPEGGVRGRYEPLEHGNWLEVLLADLRALRAERAGR